MATAARFGVTLEIFKDRRGRWHWRERAANGEVTATAQAYASKSNAFRAACRRSAYLNAPFKIVVV